MPPPLLVLPDEAAYRRHYLQSMCQAGTIATFDGITVQFFPEQFNHAFFRDSSSGVKDKARFDWNRAQRMNWIGEVLIDPSAELYRSLMHTRHIRRIALWLPERYVVIIELRKKQPARAAFVTAFVVDSDSALAKIRSNPRWV